MVKKTIAIIISSCIVIGGFVGVLFATGKIGNKYESTIVKENMDIKRDNFKHSKSFVEGKVTDLAKCKREYERAKDLSEKKAISNYISSEFANFDIKLIEDNNLRNFLSDIRSGLK